MKKTEDKASQDLRWSGLPESERDSCVDAYCNMPGCFENSNMLYVLSSSLESLYGQHNLMAEKNRRYMSRVEQAGIKTGDVVWMTCGDIFNPNEWRLCVFKDISNGMFRDCRDKLFSGICPQKEFAVYDMLESVRYMLWIRSGRLCDYYDILNKCHKAGISFGTYALFSCDRNAEISDWKLARLCDVDNDAFVLQGYGRMQFMVYLSDGSDIIKNPASLKDYIMYIKNGKLRYLKEDPDVDDWYKEFTEPVS